MQRTAASTVLLLLAAGALLATATGSARGDGPILLGVNVGEVTSPEARQLGVTAREGAVINRVFPGYVGQRAGLKAGDVVIACGNQRITNAEELKRVIHASTPGNRHRLTILRGGRQIFLDLNLGATNGGEPAVPAAGPAGADGLPAEAPMEPYLGMQLRSAGHPEAVAAGIESPLGTAVLDVTPGAPAAKAGLRRGDLIVAFADREIQTYEDLEAATLRSPIGSRQRVVFVRGDQRLATEIAIGSRAATSPPSWYQHPGGGYRFRVPGRWGGYSRVEPELPAERHYSAATSTEGAYELIYFHGSWEAGEAEPALEQFVRQNLAENPDSRVTRLSLGNAPAAMVAFYSGAEKRRATYRICLVHGNRRYVIHAYAPPLSDVDRLPPVLADVLGTIQFPRPDVVQAPPPVAVPVPDPPPPASPPSQAPAPVATQPPVAPPVAAPPAPPVSSQGYFADESLYQRERKALDADTTRLQAAFEKKDAVLATTLTHPAARADYGSIFKEHQTELTRVGALLGTRKLMVLTPEMAEFEVNENGRAFRITFEKYGGQWLLSGL